MKKIHSVFAILLLSMLIAEIPIIAESQLTNPSLSPKPSPSPPEFTARFVPSSLEVTIKNQPITAYVTTNGSNPSLYYGFRFKDHEKIQELPNAAIIIIMVGFFLSFGLFSNFIDGESLVYNLFQGVFMSLFTGGVLFGVMILIRRRKRRT